MATGHRAATLVFFALVAGCAAHHPDVAPPAAPASAHAHEGGGWSAEGIASWYGPGFAGRLTANGERFDPSALTCAHRTLPFGTRLEVTNLENGRTVVVRVNDRGPYAHGRLIDLSAEAARRLGMRASGTARVRVTVLDSRVGTR